MAHTSQTEIERKYAVEGEQALPALDGVGRDSGVEVAEVRRLEPFTLEAVYVDTDDLALARRRIALRRRRGGHDAGWHVKLPAAEGRTELQWPLGDDDDSVPDEVRAAVLVHVRDRALTPLARITTSRHVTELRDADGGLVVEIADDTVRASDARSGVARLWHEWEAELGPAAPDTPDARSALLDEIEGRLLAAGAVVSPSVSKLAQALGRTGLGRDDEGGDDESGDESPSAVPAAVARVRAGVAELTEQLIELDPAVRDDEPDAVHRMRTTVRRIRNALAVHRTLFEGDGIDRLREQLARFGGVLGEVRDLEVRTEWASHALGEIARERGVDDPDAVRRLVDDTRAEHREAHERLRRVMEKDTYFRLLDGLDAFAGTDGGAAGGPQQADGAVPAEGAGQSVSAPPAAEAAAVSPKKEAKRAVRRAGRRALSRTVPAEDAKAVLEGDVVHAAESLGALHDSRKAARRLRHAAEFSTTGAAAVLGSSTRSLGETAEDLQDALGLHRDASLFAEFVLLTSRRADAAGESSFTYGVLYQRSLDQARQALDAAESARRALSRAI